MRSGSLCRTMRRLSRTGSCRTHAHNEHAPNLPDGPPPKRTDHEPIDIETDPEPRVIAMHATHAETAAPHAADVAQPFEYSAADRPPAEFLEFDLSQLLDTSGRLGAI